MRLHMIFAVALMARAAAAASHADLFIDLQLPAKLQTRHPILTGSVRNNGPDAAENVKVTATTSDGQRFDFSLGTVYPIAGQPFTLVFPEDEAEFRLDVRATSTTADPDSVNDTVSGPLQVSSAPKLYFSLDAFPADPGEAVIYNARFFNSGFNDASRVAFTIPLD